MMNAYTRMTNWILVLKSTLSPYKNSSVEVAQPVVPVEDIASNLLHLKECTTKDVEKR
jgi:hypothetical protein